MTTCCSRLGKSPANNLSGWSFPTRSAAAGAGRRHGCWECSPWPPRSCSSSWSSATSPTAWPSWLTASTCSAMLLPWWEKQLKWNFLSFRVHAGHCLHQHYHESEGMEQEHFWLGKSWGETIHLLPSPHYIFRPYCQVVGALVNSVFLVALCFSITVESIKRFLEPEEIKDPKLILIVGGVGLGINLVGRDYIQVNSTIC